MIARTPPQSPVLRIVSRRLGSARAWLACGTISTALHIGVMAAMPTGGAGSSAPLTLSSGVLLQVDVVPKMSTTRETEWQSPLGVSQTILPVPPSPKLSPMPAIARTPAPFDEGLYIPAKQLTIRPSAAQYISVPYPKGANQGGTWTLTLAIFIDEDGKVVRVRPAGNRLPSAYEQAAIDTFSSARFHPGRMGPTPVKSRLLVEVEFDHEEGDQYSPRLAAMPGKR